MPPPPPPPITNPGTSSRKRKVPSPTDSPKKKTKVDGDVGGDGISSSSSAPPLSARDDGGDGGDEKVDDDGVDEFLDWFSVTRTHRYTKRGVFIKKQLRGGFGLILAQSPRCNPSRFVYVKEVKPGCLVLNGLHLIKAGDAVLKIGQHGLVG